VIIMNDASPARSLMACGKGVLLCGLTTTLPLYVTAHARGHQTKRVLRS
jgi:hypothetical protein